MKTKLLITIVFLVLCVSGECLANPVVIFQIPSFGGGFAVNAGYAIIIDCVADFTALLIGYFIINKIRVVASWKFLQCFGMVLVGGIIIDFVSLIPIAILNFLFLPADDFGKLGFFICAGFLLYLYNYMLSKRFLKNEATQAQVIGIVMAILTNPVLGWFFGENIHGLW